MAVKGHASHPVWDTRWTFFHIFPKQGPFAETRGTSLIAQYYTAEALASQPPPRCPARKAEAGAALDLPPRF